jgi:hypothetical protein
MPIDPSPHRHEQPDRVLSVAVHPELPADPPPAPPAEAVVMLNDCYAYRHIQPIGHNRLSLLTGKPSLLVAPRGGFGWQPEMEPDPDLRPDVDGSPPIVVPTHGPVPEDWVPGFDPDPEPDPVALRLVGRRVPERPPVAPATDRRAFGGNALAAVVAWGLPLLVAEVIVVAAVVAAFGGG